MKTTRAGNYIIDMLWRDYVLPARERIQNYEKLFRQLEPAPPSNEDQEELGSKIQRYHQTLIARYYNDKLSEPQKNDLNKIIDEIGGLIDRRKPQKR
jgi:hypothetical protein